MYHNHRKTIGLFVEQITFEFQRQVIKGVLEKAEELGYNVAAFCGYGKYGGNTSHSMGDRSIYDLPDYKNLAGVIICQDTFPHDETLEGVLEKIKKDCKCPIVSLREPLENASNFYVDNKTCMSSMVEHFIVEHKMKNLCFMSGPEDRWDAKERMQGFLETMEKHGLPVTERQMFYGDFWFNMGPVAYEHFYADGYKPEAIICANDNMAITMATELIKRGYEIPNDVCVSGYDGLRETSLFTPSITTAAINFTKMGLKAVQVIHENQDTPEKTDDYYFDTVLLLRESCGCKKLGNMETVFDKHDQFLEAQANTNRDIQFDYLMININECNNFDDIVNELNHVRRHIPGLVDYVLCLKENLNADDRSSKLKDHMQARIHIKQFIPQEDRKIPFLKKDLLPRELCSEDPQFWFFTPMHYREVCYGYEAYRFKTPEEAGNTEFRWNVILANKIRDMLLEEKMHGLISELEHMYIRDELTGLYNRRGMRKYGNVMFDEAVDGQEPVFLAVVDLDGMKQINDNYGHNEGDFSLMKISEIMKKVCKNDYIACRTGGDEFLIVAKGIPEEEARACIKDIDKKIDEFNESQQKEYKIHISHGYAHAVPNMFDTLEGFLKIADEKMYKNKVINKVSRGEALR